MGIPRYSWLKSHLLPSLALGALVCAGAACSSEPTGPGLRLRLAGGTLPIVGCVDPASKRTVDATALLQSGTVRISVVSRVNGTNSLLCDATATVPTETLS